MANSTQAASGGKHTPGPWKVDDDVIRHGTVAVATVHEYQHVSAETIHANAHLIAAAPDLLKQLEALMVQIEFAPDLCVPPGVRKAISKARAGSLATDLLVALAAAAVATITLLWGLQ